MQGLLVYGELMAEGSRILRGMLCDLRSNPFQSGDALRFSEDGCLLIDAQGRIEARLEPHELPPGVPVEDLRGCCLLPGAVDAHVHLPQVFMQAAWGEKLLSWLERYTFPEELRYADPAYARRGAAAFCSQLLRAGTTTACVYGSVFPAANRAAFEAAAQVGLRAIIGPTAMDRDVPAGLRTAPEQTAGLYDALFHEFDRPPYSGVALTPRFALSSSPAQLEVCGSWLAAHPDCLVQTHINENRDEISAVRALFPELSSYLAVYEQAGLLGERTLLGHSIYTTEAELAQMARRGSWAVHCPSSNLFLGSGLFSLEAHHNAGVQVCLGTDIGGGSHFSLFESLQQVYGIAQLGGRALRAEHLLYLATLAGAEALGWQSHIGNLEPGKRADLVCVDLQRDPLLAERLRHCDDGDELLFALLFNLRREHIREVYVDGVPRGPALAELIGSLAGSDG